MAKQSVSTEIALLLDLLDQGYDKKAWHGPNLRGAIRRVSAQQAAWRSNRARHTIAELVVHSAYWKYKWLSDTEWRYYVTLLDEHHREVREAIAGFPAAQLQRRSLVSKYTAVGLITGIAAHDIYHAGQIQVLKRLQTGVLES